MVEPVRMQEIAVDLKEIVSSCNDISEEELKALLAVGRQREAIQPLLDPTAWRDGGGQADAAVMTVFQALLDFKVKVKGIGNFR